ncbi:MAG: tRNA cyclic N6-threonylcarbamoyladenosine(37) synthase TcdA [Gammaproteobacteria bacterium]|jgi:tRNA A37 threonylcarbamoyladenosine dehydratase|nr:tRNA cyclic N6-threonylcarbamoyladenosine(37) synthase TcdA [Gammaproteobacteria bacterium]
MSDFEEKFDSLSRVYGNNVLQKIRGSHICIVGIGGVGSWAAEALARSGVGKLTLVDGDTISKSNMNRQIHTLDSSIGKVKVDVMSDRILQINAECEVKTIKQYIDENNQRDILERGYDGVIDAIDSLKFKAAIIYNCKRNKIPIVTTGGAGGLTDPTMVEVKDLSRTWNDPLAAAVRLCLRQQYNFTRNLKRSFGVPCVFSIEQQRYPDKDGEPGFCKPGVAGLSLDCNFGYGSSVMVTASFGFSAAAKAIELILKK